MLCQIENKTATSITINVRVSYSEIEPTMTKAAEVISANTEIEGFRKGKAPYEVIKQRIGEAKILEEAARMFIEKHFGEIVDRVGNEEYKGTSFEPVGSPRVAITKLAPGEDIEYRIALTLLPHLELPDYKAIAKRFLKEKKVPEVTDQDLEAAIKWLSDSRAKLVTVNRAAGLHDRVEVDFQATHGGAPLEGASSKNHPIILGQEQLLPGFDEALVGMKAGDTKTFSLSIPREYSQKNIAGKTLDVTAEVKLVQERDVPAWNDEFASSIGNFATTADVEKSVRDGLQAEKEGKERERLRMAMIEEIARSVKAEIPDVLIDRELDKMVAELEQSIGRMGFKFDEYLQHIKKTAEELKEDWRGDAKARVKIALTLREIARQEKISPSDEEIQEAMKRNIERLGLAEENIKTLDREAFLDYNRGIARNEKVFKHLENIENKEYRA